MITFKKPTEEQLAIKGGDWVFHTKYGIGKVKTEWGVWDACRRCYSPIENKNKKCPFCNSDTGLTYRISGEGIVDVEFARNRKIHSINKVWLQPYIESPETGFTPSVTYRDGERVTLNGTPGILRTARK